MPARRKPESKQQAAEAIRPDLYLNVLPSALIAVDPSLQVTYLNPAAEILFALSMAQAEGRQLPSLPGFDEELCSLCQRVFQSGEAVSLLEQTLRLPFDHRVVTMHLTPVADTGQVLIAIEKSDGLNRLTASQWKQEAMRAAGVMAAMLAHEVKNPLSGIRGAAQLLRDEGSAEHRQLTELICLETDRIRDLLDQVEIFADGAPTVRLPINIHEVLQYVIQVAAAGFARHVTFKERYDPSLPMVSGRRELLVQLFLNLVKNAAEAMTGQPDATITLTTSYRSGFSIQGDQRMALPIIVTVGDNGPGIPDAIRARLFEPFVSSKEAGRGLGLAIVAKIAADLGALVELDKEYDGGTKFIVWLACGE